LKDDDFAGVCPFHGDCLEGLVTNVSIAKRLGLTIDDLKDLKDDNPVWQIVGHYLAGICLNLTLICSPEKILIGR
jgi:fructokinase